MVDWKARWEHDLTCHPGCPKNSTNKIVGIPAVTLACLWWFVTWLLKMAHWELIYRLQMAICHVDLSLPKGNPHSYPHLGILVKIPMNHHQIPKNRPKITWPSPKNPASPMKFPPSPKRRHTQKKENKKTQQSPNQTPTTAPRPSWTFASGCGPSSSPRPSQRSPDRLHVLGPRAKRRGWGLTLKMLDHQRFLGLKMIQKLYIHVYIYITKAS